MSATVACVLKSGGIYGPEYVGALVSWLTRFAPEASIVCLSDWAGAGTPLRFNLPGWWSKMELFRPGVLEGPVLYMDLDTLPVGDLSALLAYDGPLALLSDFYRPHLAQSGVMAFTPGDETADLWNRFIADPPAHMRAYRGDGEFIHAHAPGAARLQDLFPGQIVSLKAHAKAGPPPNARLVCCHGQPKLHDPAAGWAHTAWGSA